MPGTDSGSVAAVRRTAEILVVEDDPEVRGLLELVLRDAGHRPVSAPDGVTALKLVTNRKINPDLILADYNLPNGMDGLQLTAKLREKLLREIPAAIITGDISTGTLRDVALQNCALLNKPVKLDELTEVVQRLLTTKPAPGHSQAPRAGEKNTNPGQPVIFVIDDDSHIREGIRAVLEEDGRTVEDFATCEEFLEAYQPGGEACLVIDAYLPGMSGLDLLKRLRDRGDRLPAIMITGNSDVPMAVQAMKAGAMDFIEKPIGRDELVASIEHAVDFSRDSNKLLAWQESAADHIAGLTTRQRQIMEMVLAGHPSKNIAADLGISQRTVENHRAAIMKKTGATSLPALARLAIAAASDGADEPAT
jgi:two-component system CheB/CheR fusion protein